MEYPSLFVCLMGMGTVFFGLICLIVLTMVMGKIVGGHGGGPPGARPQPRNPTVRKWWPPSPPPSRRSLAPTSRASGSYP